MKNFKLLLGATALLSTTLAANSFADDPAPVTGATYANRVSATLSADIEILSPITMTSGSILFPNITTTNMNNYESVKIKVNHDGSVDYAGSTAQSFSTASSVTPIVITGGEFGKWKDTFANLEGEQLSSTLAGFNGSGNWAGSTYTLIVADTIPMYELDGNSQATNTLCGEVGALERYWYYDTSLNNNKGGVKVNFGGTFTVDDDYNPTAGRARCKGSTTVTLLMYGANSL